VTGSNEHTSCPGIRLTSNTAQVVIPNSGFGVGGGAWTLETWIRVDNPKLLEGQLFMMNSAYSVGAVRMGAGYNGGIQCNVYAPWVPVYSGPIDDGKWHHIACTYSNGTLTMYRDGVAVDSASASPNLQTLSPFAIGLPTGYEKNVPRVSLGAIRFSSTNRYGGNFSPASAWSVDGSTVAQYLSGQSFNGSKLIDEAQGNNSSTSTTDVNAIKWSCSLGSN